MSFVSRLFSLRCALPCVLCILYFQNCNVVGKRWIITDWIRALVQTISRHFPTDWTLPAKEWPLFSAKLWPPNLQQTRSMHNRAGFEPFPGQGEGFYLQTTRLCPMVTTGYFPFTITGKENNWIAFLLLAFTGFMNSPFFLVTISDMSGWLDSLRLQHCRISSLKHLSLRQAFTLAFCV